MQNVAFRKLFGYQKQLRLYTSCRQAASALPVWHGCSTPFLRDCAASSFFQEVADRALRRLPITHGSIRTLLRSVGSRLMICGASHQDRNANRHKASSGWRRTRHGMESIASTHRKPFAALLRISPSFRRLRR